MKNSFILSSFRKTTFIAAACLSIMLLFSLCTPKPAEQPVAAVAETKPNYGGFESKEKWEEHLITILRSHDCHTPKMMTDKGPAPNWDLALSGHHADAPDPDVDRKAMESKGLIVTNDLTVWVGPWGVS